MIALILDSSKDAGADDGCMGPVPAQESVTKVAAEYDMRFDLVPRPWRTVGPWRRPG